jgi:hypothetical protein
LIPRSEGILAPIGPDLSQLHLLFDKHYDQRFPEVGVFPGADPVRQMA